MRAAMIPSMGLCCLPSCHFAFHVSRGLPTVPARARATEPWTQGIRSGTAEMVLSGSLIAAGNQPAAGEVDGQPAWAEDFELDCQGKVMLKSLLFSETEELMGRLGEKPGRAEVLAGWLYHDRRLIRDIAETAEGSGGGGRDGGGHGDDNSNSVTSSKSRIGRKTRETVRAVATADGGIELEDVQLAADGTRKLVSVLTSGEGAGKKVETVIIPMLRGPQREPRYTICVSSQVGCAMNCQFCYTGRLGLMANLQAAQIVEQVLVAKRFLESVGDPAPITGVVFMGMGEPFDNYERVMRAVKILTDPRAGVRLKASSVTVSTVGLVPQIERFCKDAGNGASLAISLHAVTDDIRDKLIPVNRRYPLAQLSETLRTHFPRISKPKLDEPPPVSSSDRSKDEPTNHSAAVPSPTPLTNVVAEGKAAPPVATAVREGEELVRAQAGLFKRRKSDAKGSSKPIGGVKPIEEATGLSNPTDVGIYKRPQRRRKSRILAVEYTLLGGVNDSLEDAHGLADWLRGVACVVNLITFNAHEGTPFSSSSLKTSEAFRQALTARGQLCTFRDSRGDDGMAACGQLGGESMAGNGDRARKPVPVAWEPSSIPQGASVGTSA